MYIASEWRENVLLCKFFINKIELWSSMVLYKAVTSQHSIFLIIFWSIQVPRKHNTLETPWARNTYQRKIINTSLVDSCALEIRYSKVEACIFWEQKKLSVFNILRICRNVVTFLCKEYRVRTESFYDIYLVQRCASLVRKKTIKFIKFNYYKY